MVGESKDLSDLSAWENADFAARLLQGLRNGKFNTL